MVKLLKQSSISLHFEKHKVNGDYSVQLNRNPNSIHYSKTKNTQASTRTVTISFWNRKMTERMASGWMTVWRLGCRLKWLKDAVKMVGSTVQLGVISLRKAKKCKWGVERGYEETKEAVVAKRISFPQWPRNETTPPFALWFVLLTKRGLHLEKDVIGDEKKWRIMQESFCTQVAHEKRNYTSLCSSCHGRRRS